MTPAVIAQACGCTLMRAANWAAPLAEACALWGIDTPQRQAAWLPQIGHESARLALVRELWGPAQVPSQARYERNMAAPWPASPEQAKLPAFDANRLAYTLGNSQPGDGFRYRGRGLIQITGRGNYGAARDGLRKVLQGVPDFEAQPEALEAPKWAAHTAGWYWQSRGLNRWADSGTRADFETITRRINGGLNGLDDRLKLWAAARLAFGV